MLIDQTVTLANHHPLHSAIFRRQFQEAHEQNVARHNPLPSPAPEPVPHLAPSATRPANHTHPVIVYKGL